MTQELHDRIYNTTLETMNYADKEYFEKLLHKKNQKETIVQPLYTGLIMGILTFIGIVGFRDVVFGFTIQQALKFGGLMFVTSNLVGSLLFGAISIHPANIKYSELGLTKKEFKEIVKSKRLKVIKEMVKQYEKTLKSELDCLNSQEEELIEKIKIVEEKRNNLLQRMTNETSVEVDKAEEKQENINDNDVVDNIQI